MFGFFSSNNNNNNNNNNNQNKGNAKKQAPKKQALDEDDFEEIAPKVNKTTAKDTSVLGNEMTTSIADWQTIESSVVITKTKATTAPSTSPQAAPVIIQTQKEVKIDKTIPQTQTTVENNKIDNNNNNNSNTNDNKPNHISMVETVSVKKETIVVEKEPVVEVETPVKESVVEKEEEEEEEPEWKKQLANRDKTPYAFATPSPPYTIHTQKDPSFVETSTTAITYTQTQSNKQPYTVSSSSNSNYVVTTSGTEYASPQSNKHDPPYSVAY